MVVKCEEGSGHLEGELVVGEGESGSSREEVVTEGSVDATALFLPCLLHLHLVLTLSLFQSLHHFPRLLLQHGLLL